MNLQTFNKTTMPNERQSSLTPRLTINPKGVFSLNRKAAQIMKLSENDKVSISQDADDPVNWYIHKDADGFDLRLLNKTTAMLGFNNISLKNAIVEAMEFSNDKITSATISSNCTKIGKVKVIEYWPIIFTS
jgi:hypothetical protein